MSPSRAQQGLTLLETVLAVALLALVLAAVYALVTVGARGWAGLVGQADVQQHPRVAVSRILAEVRQSRDFVISSGGTSLGLVKVTRLTADALPGATAVSVEDASPLAAGRPVTLIRLTSAETASAASVAGTTVTLSAPLGLPHRRGEPVRRGQTTLAAPAAAGTTTLAVADAVLAAGDAVAVGTEGPFVVTAVAGTSATVTPALGRSHAAGEPVQPLAVVYTLAGTQLLRNGVVLADLLSAPPGRALFSAPAAVLAAGVPVGATRLCVDTVAGFSAGDRVQVGQELYGVQAFPADRLQVLSVDSAAGCLVVSPGVAFARPAGTPVRVMVVEVSLLASQYNDALGQTQTAAIVSRAALRN
ncbi:MAG: prepilin-type N-terminal cleavage/methylation domain-containing protein [Armatimonadota bacterium]|nr:prepilin-type N-terminal cleavage/methylation domain-containing protein [Armatimonadota bacterium]MDR7436600.1 prepilin-type N-terminal cleavage/methylation domain-containing protein [Armatimonadota bacterium]MDR7472981.1 prepilin-type N-terminal cleavage/methylation domain-containing protein [Armatimonadota bacterium]MDR7506611.1 prepilin-type N-terminal cleavage/methylation domain-containing protein [Armatimonadota bacterium]MDR7509153.1 prepilin-type N-terminal cleavage/methylation domain